ncbi:MAG: HDOD domain-containing protein [Rhodocyclales bacterium]|nr:HDOD domain-containing protein [Rhodocyclales bacterium]
MPFSTPSWPAAWCCRHSAATRTDHAAIGSLVARIWKLPPEVIEAVLLHHRPVAAEHAEPHAASLATLVAVGRRLRDGPSDEWADWAPLAESHLGLDEQAICFDLATVARPSQFAYPPG